MAASRRRLIMEAIKARVSEISVTHGFETDAGLTVFLGETPQLGPDDPQTAIAIVVGDEEPQYQGAKFLIRLPLALQALARADLDQPWLAVEDVIGDLKRAVELEDRTLGGLVKSDLERRSVVAMEREPGSTTVGAEVTYLFTYSESWGAP